MYRYRPFLELLGIKYFPGMGPNTQKAKKATTLLQSTYPKKDSGGLTRIFIQTILFPKYCQCGKLGLAKFSNQIFTNFSKASSSLPSSMAFLISSKTTISSSIKDLFSKSST